MKPKILAILGPTATGKSNLAVQIAKKYNGEIISADSRQVYVGLNIGTGKITKKEMFGIPHHMLDVVSPKKVFSVSDWQKQTKKIITEIISRGKLPIICGGTGFYIQSIVDNIILPEVPPNKELRKKLEKKSLPELQKILMKLDLDRFKSVEIKNPIRLIRAIEIATELGSVPKIKKNKSQYEFLQIGLTLPDNELKTRIHNRLLSRIKEGMIKEAQKLHQNGLSWKRMNELGLEYRYLSKYLKKFPRLSTSSSQMSAMATELEVAIWHYAKRQVTWFKRDKKIKWYKPEEMKNIEKDIRNFIG